VYRNSTQHQIRPDDCTNSGFQHIASEHAEKSESDTRKPAAHRRLPNNEHGGAILSSDCGIVILLFQGQRFVADY
jgi:hypothetical protein